MYKLVLLRHGESVWNRDNRFTGWMDVDLSPQGIAESIKAGQTLKKEGLEFDCAFDSVLKRTDQTLKIALEELGQTGIPVHYSWRLNERHYGALQGLNKSEMAAKFGEGQVLIWRRSYDVRPPELEVSDPRFPGNDPLYAELDRKDLPVGESLKDTVERVLPYWHQEIAPAIQQGKRVAISACGNSLRALIKHLDQVSEQEIVKLNLPTGIPLVYELDADLKPIRHYYLGDPKEIEKAIERVVNQGKAK